MGIFSMIRRFCLLSAMAAAMTASPAGAGFLTISPAGTTGPGGTILSSEIGPNDPTAAFVNNGFTAPGRISFTFTASDGSPLAIYGSEINNSASTWSSFTASVVSGAATFQAPNDPFNPYGTYSNSPGFLVTLSNGGGMATFSGGMIAPGDSLDAVLGLVVSDPSRPVTIDLTPVAASTSVPAPPAALLSAIGAAILGLGRQGRRLRARVARAIPAVAAVAAAVALTSPVARADGPRVVAAYQQGFTLGAVGTVPGSPTQMTFGPDGRLYAMTADAGAISFAYDPATGALSSPVHAAPGVRGIGIAFHGRTMYLSSFDGTIHKLDDAGNNGIWGEPGELDVAIVTGLPQGDHNTDQIQIAGDTLYVGIGRRTINGHVGAYTSGLVDDLGGRGFFSFGGLGRTYGDSAYNGTIAWIRDLTAVVDRVGSANAWTAAPPTLSRALLQSDAGPFSGGGPGSLVVHSAGTRNPFGLCLDNAGSLWFTNNFNRTTTLGNGQAGFGLRGDQLDSDFSRDVHDQLFQASPGADYGYTDVNWRGVNPMLTPSAPGYHRVTSTTFDNSFNKGPYTLHDPANPDGMGPSASADGCAFAYSTNLPGELRGNIFIARFNGTITEAPGGQQRSLTYSDLVAVDVSAGKVRRIASGFKSPLAVLADDAAGRILVADYGNKVVYALQAVAR